MNLGELKDGGIFILQADILEKWKRMYKNQDVEMVINTLATHGEFRNLTKQAALKLINKTLMDLDPMFPTRQ